MVCGNSDPGRNGLLSPWGKIEGLYFDDSEEVGNYLYNLQKDLDEYYHKKNKIFLKVSTDDEAEYYRIMKELQDYYDDVRCYGTLKDGPHDILIDTEDFFNDDEDAKKLEVNETENAEK